MQERKINAIIRFRSYNKDSEPEEWCRAKLVLYYLRRVEETDLLGRFGSYQQHYNNVLHVILPNKEKYTNKEYEHIENQTEQATDRLSNMQSVDGDLNNEIVEVLRTVDQEDNQHNESLYTDGSISTYIYCKHSLLLLHMQIISLLKHADKCTKI